MREIIFRGKDTTSGAFVYGDLVQGVKKQRGLAFIWSEDDLSPICIYEHNVDPETVGQFTGLTDKNGNKIFEGDVVRYFQRLLGGEDYEHKDPVLFLEGGFTVGVYFLNHWLRDIADGNVRLEGIEVIGNIHENPELLEV